MNADSITAEITRVRDQLSRLEAERIALQGELEALERQLDAVEKTRTEQVTLKGAAVVTAAGLASFALSGAPVALVVGMGIGFAIGAGIVLDWLDNMTGFKAVARKIGRKFGRAVDKGFSATVAFVERISTGAEGIIDGWFQSFSNNLRQNDPNGWCALFCSSSLDQVRAWQRAFTGRSPW